MINETVETELLKDLTLAEDAENEVLITRAHLALLDFYDRQGCPSPAGALLASLLINPLALVRVRLILPKPEIFEGAKDRQLYAAMLRYPCGGDTAQWWRVLAEASELSVLVVIGYLDYDFYNCHQCEVYALLLLMDAARRRVAELAGRLVKQFCAGQPIAAIDTAARDLASLRQRLMEVQQ